jgi:hypothetical protein
MQTLLESDNLMASGKLRLLVLSTRCGPSSCPLDCCRQFRRSDRRHENIIGAQANQLRKGRFVEISVTDKRCRRTNGPHPIQHVCRATHFAAWRAEHYGASAAVYKSGQTFLQAIFVGDYFNMQ